MDWREPDWDKYERIMCWRNYVSEDLKAIWYTFSDVQKYLIAKNADEIAGREEWD